jgi:subtilase family serine protease
MKFKHWSACLFAPLVIANLLHAQTNQVSNQLSQLANVVHLTPREIREGHAKFSAAYDPVQHLRISFGLKTPHADDMKQYIEELHDRDSPNFMKFLTPAETIARFSPSAADEQAVVDWAEGQGLTVIQRYPNRLLVDVDAPVANIQQALHVAIGRYQMDGASYFSNDRDPAIPTALSNIIESVAGLNNIQVFRPVNSRMQEPVFAEYSAGAPVTKAAQGGASADPAQAQAYLKAATHAETPIANITGGAYDPTDMFSSQAYDTQALYNQGHCCNPTGHAGGSPPETSIAIATAGRQDPNDFVGFHNRYPYL